MGRGRSQNKTYRPQPTQRKAPEQILSIRVPPVNGNDWPLSPHPSGITWPWISSLQLMPSLKGFGASLLTAHLQRGARQCTTRSATSSPGPSSKPLLTPHEAESRQVSMPGPHVPQHLASHSASLACFCSLLPEPSTSLATLYHQQLPQ